MKLNLKNARAEKKREREAIKYLNEHKAELFFKQHLDFEGVTYYIDLSLTTIYRKTPNLTKFAEIVGDWEIVKA